ncbi:MAG TPA: ABC transporter permease subunit [Thermoanaerobaculia bacterium]|nr:ABC transporter permease subunit [Thermoanaerobaculia bacterium]
MTPRAHSSAASWAGALLALPLLLFLLAAVAWPLAHLVRRAFLEDGEALRQVMAAGRYRTALVNSLALSAAAAVTALLLALGPAWILARERFRGRQLLRTAISLPLTFSGVLVGFLIVVLLGRIGAIPKLIEALTGRQALEGAAYTFGGLFLGYVYFEVPRAVMTLESAFRRFPWELDAAARTLGARGLERMLRIGLPIAAPALRSTLAVTFSASMGSFGVALILSRRFTVAPLEIYTEMTGFLNDEVAGALCLALALCTLTVDRLLALGKRR